MLMDSDEQQNMTALSLLFGGRPVKKAYEAVITSRKKGFENTNFHMIMSSLCGSVVFANKKNKNDPNYYELPAKVFVHTGNNNLKIITKNGIEIELVVPTTSSVDFGELNIYVIGQQGTN